MRIVPILGMGLAGAVVVSSACADTFGTAGNSFTIDFVTIGNSGNPDDAGAGGGIASAPYGGVSYNYRIGTYEITQDSITKATAGGLQNVAAGAWLGNQPAADVTWYEAAAFVNWLNDQRIPGLRAYNLDLGATSLTPWSSANAWQLGGENLFRHKDAYYFLPSEDEWYKAAFHKNDGVTANYWDYATGSNTIPTAVMSGTGAGTVVYDNVTVLPAAVNHSGGLSAYGTMGQNGNVWEWTESNFDGTNSSVSDLRAVRNGAWDSDATNLLPGDRNSNDPTDSINDTGFRVASIPESSSVLGVILSGALILLRKRPAKVA